MRLTTQVIRNTEKNYYGWRLCDFLGGIWVLIVRFAHGKEVKFDLYIHGALYAANPYVRHTMDHIHVDYLCWAKCEIDFLKHLAEKMECSAFGNWKYNSYMSWLEKEAKKLMCSVEKLRGQVEEFVCDMAL